MPRRIAIAALGLISACRKAPPEERGGIDQLYSLRQVMNETDLAFEGTLVEVDRERLAAVLKVGRSLKGACPHVRLLLDLQGSFLPYRNLIRRQLVENAPVVLMFYQNSGLLYFNRVFYMGYLVGASPDMTTWASSNIEQRMNRTYNGSVESLAGLISGAAVPPAPQAELPPIDTAALRALPPPGEPVDEEYLPAPFRRKAAAPPVLRDPENPAKVVEGLHLDTFENIMTYRTDLDDQVPARTDVALRPELPALANKDHVAFRFRGYVDIPKDGEYSFFVRSEGTAELKIGDAAVTAKDRETAMDVALKAGRHPFRLTSLGWGGEQTLQVSWCGPGFAKQPLPSKALSR